MKKKKFLNQGNITLITIVMSALVLGFGITVTSIMTSSVISIQNISKSTKAYYEAEAGAENGYYLFAGHLAGFEYNYDNDSACEIDSGDDKWCLRGRINSLPESDTGTDTATLLDNSVLTVGLYNDISENPYGSISTSNVDLTNHNIYIRIYPTDGEDATSNNWVGQGDTRITSVDTGSDIYDEKTQVESGDSDEDDRLESIVDTSTTCYMSNYTISGDDKIWDNGEFVYRDIDSSNDVSLGDIRMVTIGSYGAATTVQLTDSDIGTPLQSNVLNIGCSESNPSYLYATDVAQIIISGSDDDGNKSVINVISKNQLSGTNGSNPLSFTNDMLGNTGVDYTNCSLAEFVDGDNGSGGGKCGIYGDMSQPQLDIYTFATKIDYYIDSDFSDFNIDNSGGSCTICPKINLAGSTDTSTGYDHTHTSPNITSISANNTYVLQIEEIGSSLGPVLTSNIVVSPDDSLSEVAFNMQNALNDTTNLSYDYSVSYRDGKFTITGTGITLTNPETTLVSKGEENNFQQSIQTSITDSSLVPIFGWYSVF